MKSVPQTASVSTSRSFGLPVRRAKRRVKPSDPGWLRPGFFVFGLCLALAAFGQVSPVYGQCEVGEISCNDFAAGAHSNTVILCGSSDCGYIGDGALALPAWVIATELTVNQYCLGGGNPGNANDLQSRFVGQSPGASTPGGVVNFGSQGNDLFANEDTKIGCSPSAHYAVCATGTIETSIGGLISLGGIVDDRMAIFVDGNAIVFDTRWNDYDVRDVFLTPGIHTVEFYSWDNNTQGVTPRADQAEFAWTHCAQGFFDATSVPPNGNVYRLFDGGEVVETVAKAGRYQTTINICSGVAAWGELIVDEIIPDADSSIMYTIKDPSDNSILLGPVASLGGLVDISGISPARSNLTLCIDMTYDGDPGSTCAGPRLESWRVTYDLAPPPPLRLDAQCVGSTNQIPHLDPSIVSFFTNCLDHSIQFMGTQAVSDTSINLGTCSSGFERVYTISVGCGTVAVTQVVTYILDTADPQIIATAPSNTYDCTWPTDPVATARITGNPAVLGPTYNDQLAGWDVTDPDGDATVVSTNHVSTIRITNDCLVTVLRTWRVVDCCSNAHERVESFRYPLDPQNIMNDMLPDLNLGCIPSTDLIPPPNFTDAGTMASCGELKITNVASTTSECQFNIVIVATDGAGAGAVATYATFLEGIYGVANVNIMIDQFSNLATGPDNLAALQAADLIIVDRNTSSSSYDDGLTPIWNGLTAPLLLHSPYLARSADWNWIPGGIVENQDGSALNINEADIAFAGICPLDNPFAALPPSANDIDISNSGGPINGEIIALDSANQIAMARWEAGQVFHAGTTQIAGGRRVFMGTDSQAGDRFIDEATPEGLQMLENILLDLLPNCGCEQLERVYEVSTACETSEVTQVVKYVINTAPPVITSIPPATVYTCDWIDDPLAYLRIVEPPCEPTYGGLLPFGATDPDGNDTLMSTQFVFETRSTNGCDVTVRRTWRVSDCCGQFDDVEEVFTYASPSIPVNYRLVEEAEPLPDGCIELFSDVIAGEDNSSGAAWADVDLDLNFPFSLSYDVVLDPGYTIGLLLGPPPVRSSFPGAGVGSLLEDVGIGEIIFIATSFGPFSGPPVAITTAPLNDGLPHVVRLDWDPVAMTLEAYVDGVFQESLVVDLIANLGARMTFGWIADGDTPPPGAAVICDHRLEFMPAGGPAFQPVDLDLGCIQDVGQIPAADFSFIKPGCDAYSVMLIATQAVAPGKLWINEIDVDNPRIEVAGDVGLNLDGHVLQTYNSDGTIADEVNLLANSILGTPGDIGFSGVSPINTIPIDGAIALVDPDGNVLQFLSFLAAVTGVEGPAAGLTSTPIGLSDTGGYSLQLAGEGNDYDDFVWTSETPSEPNSPTVFGLNVAQIIAESGCDPVTYERVYMLMNDCVTNILVTQQVSYILDTAPPFIQSVSNFVDYGCAGDQRSIADSMSAIVATDPDGDDTIVSTNLVMEERIKNDCFVTVRRTWRVEDCCGRWHEKVESYAYNETATEVATNILTATVNVGCVSSVDLIPNIAGCRRVQTGNIYCEPDSGGPDAFQICGADIAVNRLEVTIDATGPLALGTTTVGAQDHCIVRFDRPVTLSLEISDLDQVVDLLDISPAPTLSSLDANHSATTQGMVWTVSGNGLAAEADTSTATWEGITWISFRGDSTGLDRVVVVEDVEFQETYTELRDICSGELTYLDEDGMVASVGTPPAGSSLCDNELECLYEILQVRTQALTVASTDTCLQGFERVYEVIGECTNVMVTQSVIYTRNTLGPQILTVAPYTDYACAGDQRPITLVPTFYDFDSGSNNGADLDGWTDVMGRSTPSEQVFSPMVGGRGTGGNGMGGAQDSAHLSLVMRSPPFVLYPGSVITFDLAGGSTAAGNGHDNFPPDDASIPVNSIGAEGGAQGVALRRASDGVYLLTEQRTSNANNFTPGFGFTATELNAIRLANPGEAFTLDFIDTSHGSWGFSGIDNVSISALPSSSDPTYGGTEPFLAVDADSNIVSTQLVREVRITNECDVIVTRTWRVTDCCGLFDEADEVYSYALAAAPVPGALIGYWTFDDGTDATADDFAQHPNGEHNATVVGGSFDPDDIAGPLAHRSTQSLDLSQGNHYARVDQFTGTAAHTDFDGGQSITVSAWIKYWPNENWEPFVSKRGESSEGWQLRRRSSSDHQTFTLRGTGPGDDDQEGTIDLNECPHEWHHVVGTYDGITRRIYVDGVLDLADPESGTIAATAVDVVFGARLNTGIGNYSQIKMDDISIWSVALSAEEVAQLAAGVDPRVIAGIIPACAGTNHVEIGCIDHIDNLNLVNPPSVALNNACVRSITHLSQSVGPQVGCDNIATNLWRVESTCCTGVVTQIVHFTLNTAPPEITVAPYTNYGCLGDLRTNAHTFTFDVSGNDGATLEGWADTLGESFPSAEVYSGANRDGGSRHGWLCQRRQPAWGRKSGWRP